MLKWPQLKDQHSHVPESRLLELRSKPCSFAFVADEEHLKPKPTDDPNEVQKVTCIHGKTLTIRTARIVLGLKPWKIPFQSSPLDKFLELPSEVVTNDNSTI